MEWISVKDRLPADDVFVLAHYAEFITKQELDWEWTEEAPRYVVAKVLGERIKAWYFEDSSGDYSDLASPTHWMPLPEPPQQ